MCLIIVRDPAIEIPFDKLRAACTVNPDGWGLIVNDRGKSEVIRHYSPNGNNAEEIMKRFEDAKGQRVALHLRFATHGTKNVDNCHPFVTLNQQEHGIDLHFMHNGVLSDFSKGTDKHSDTWNFNEKVLKRMMSDSLMHHGDQWVEDEYVKTVLASLAGGSNKFVLFDSTGQVMIVNRKAGADYPGWWASNVYSFRENHRDTSYSSGYYGGGGDWKKDENGVWYDASKETRSSTIYLPNKNSTSAANNTGRSIETKETTTDVSDDVEAMEVLGEKIDKLDIENVKHAFQEMMAEEGDKGGFMSEYRPTFCQLVEIDDLEEVCRLTPSDLSELVQDYPQMAVILIMDLLYGLYINDASGAA